MTSISGKGQTCHKRPRWKTLLFASLTLLFMSAVIELFSFLFIIGILETKISGLRVDRALFGLTGIGRGQTGRVAHPYLGSVYNPDAHGEEFDGRTIPINTFGFADEKSSIQKRGPDRVVIGIAGGSVAWQLSIAGEKALRDALQRSPAFRGKKIIIVRIAVSAFKQPQQLFALNYLLSLGAEFDYLINIDGFNEVALAYTHNVSVGSFYVYPYDWHARSVVMMDPRKSAIAWKLLSARGSRQEWAQRFDGEWSRFSPTLNLIWKLRDRQLQVSWQRLNEELAEARKTLGRGYHWTGPDENPETEEELFQEMVRLWKRCSIQMSGTCSFNDIEYLQFLQPNQYVKDSKPMEKQEREIALKGDHFSDDYAEAVEKGYPLLIREGADLVACGVRFHDLTMLFANTKAPIYADSCCHYNRRGNEMLASAIAAAMLASR